MKGRRFQADQRLIKTIREMKEDIEMMEWALENSPDEISNVMDRYHGHLKHHMQQISYHKRKIRSWQIRNSTKGTTSARPEDV